MGTYKGFTTVELTKPKRSTFDLSHEKRVSTRMGRLTPVFISETLPNDTFRVSTEVLIKLAPLIAPIFHRINLYVHFFFVPNRLLWEDWEDFITGGRLGPGIDTPPIPPRFDILDTLAAGVNLLGVGSLYDYLGGYPIADGAGVEWSNKSLDAMPFAAFYKIWYDYYRDRNYVADNENLPLASGPYTIVNDDFFILRQRGWQHDYFTSALLFTQRGAEVLMPMEGSGVATYLDTSLVKTSFGLDPFPEEPIVPLDAPLSGKLGVPSSATTWETGRIENIDEINVTNSSITINDFRTAYALQIWMERNALAGSRYPESIMAHFGRKSSDGRLQRAEYLGGGKAVVQISEVMTTAYSDAEEGIVPPGAMAGRGSAYSTTNGFTYNCEEHGFIIGVLSVMPSSGYMQGTPRMFLSRETFLDYPWPSFANLGEQEVYDYEIYSTDVSVPDDDARESPELFGYQSRYSDWKYIPSTSHGDFRTTLDFWHLTRKFASQPSLSEAFVTFEDTLQDRIFNVTGGDTCWMYIYNKCSAKRSLPYFGTPKLAR